MTLLVIGIATAVIIIIFGWSAAFYRLKYDYPDTRRSWLISSSTGVLVVAILATTIITQVSHPNPSFPLPPRSTGNPTCIAGTLHIESSTELEPLMQAITQEYMQHCHNTKFTITDNSSQSALNYLEDGRIDIAATDISASPTFSGLVDCQIAGVIYVVIVNQSVQLTNLTTDQLKNIYNGTYTNWRQAGGPNLPIAVFSRDSSSAIRETFDTYVLGSAEKITFTSIVDSADSLFSGVQATPGAIGYISLYQARSLAASSTPAHITVVGIDGILGTSTTIQTNTYKFWNIAHLYTKGQPAKLAQAFIHYMGNDKVKSIIQADSFVSIYDITNSTLAARNPS